MLTALSVARDSSMIGSNEHVVMVTVLPPSDSRAARVEYSFDAGRNANKVLMQNICEFKTTYIDDVHLQRFAFLNIQLFQFQFYARNK